MRRLLSLALVLALIACREKPVAKKEPAPVMAVVDAGSPPPPPPSPPPPVVLEDSGDRGELAVAPGVTLKLRPVGPYLIALDLNASPGKREIVVERRLIGHDDPVQTNRFWSARTQAQHSTGSGSTWAYRAKLEHGAWTSEVNVRTAAPTAVPPPATSATAKAASPWSVDLAWTADVRAAAGIAIEMQEENETEWELLALLNPEETKFVHNHRLPKKSARYRVSTFNEYGKSSSAETPSVTTPEIAPPKGKKLSPCTRLPPPADPMTTLAEWQVSDSPVLWSYPEGPGGAASRRLIGFYEGCLRDMGSFMLQGDHLGTVRPGTTPTEGFPVLLGIQGSGMYSGMSLGTFAFVNGHYEEVNNAFFCNDHFTGPFEPENPVRPIEIGDDATKWRGPFEGCQRDDRNRRWK